MQEIIWVNKIYEARDLDIAIQTYNFRDPKKIRIKHNEMLNDLLYQFIFQHRDAIVMCDNRYDNITDFTEMEFRTQWAKVRYI